MTGVQTCALPIWVAYCTFTCGGNILIPSSTLKQLPVSASGMADLFYIFLPPNNNAGVTSAQFKASGLDLGLFFLLDIYAQTNLSLTP